MKKIVVTGGSGFIGTNFINILIKQGNFKILNYDISKPKIEEHLLFWKNIDICNKEILIENLIIDSPDYIVHLAARTDLNEKINIDGYKSNILGVTNIMEGAKILNTLNRIIIASSMLVCKLGYSPKGFDDYYPNSLYGESKVLTEKIVKKYKLKWVIVRPTSIWGPWFGEPYKNFFNLVIKGAYFNIPAKYASTKTYGFVENTCKQILCILTHENEAEVIQNYFYLGDITPINITNWAIRIRKLNNQFSPIILPKVVLKFAAKFGDFLTNKFGLIYFPMNSFRYNNMTNNNVIQDLNRTVELTKIGLETKLDEEIMITLKWLKSNNK